MTTRRPKQETAELGEAIYQRDIRPLVEAEHHGDYVAIDVSSGCWGIGKDLIEARDRLDSQRDDVVDVWCMRVGYRTLRHFGGRPWRGAQ